MKFGAEVLTMKPFDNETTLRDFFEQLKEPSTCATNFQMLTDS
jgi:hypothetical protein